VSRYCPSPGRGVTAAAAVAVVLSMIPSTRLIAFPNPSRPPACEAPAPPDPSAPPQPPELKPTTITTIGQAYFCILDNYYSGPVLESRSLLVPTFAALTQELQRRGLDQPVATLPAFTGKKEGKKEEDDWAAFSQVYEQITARLPQDPALQQAVAEVTMRALVDSLNDNHARWQRGPQVRANWTGMRLSGFQASHLDPVATEPLFVAAVEPSSAADVAGVRPGDEILAVNGVPPYVNGVLSGGVIKWITQSTPGTPVELNLHRPATDATFMVTVIPGPPVGGPGPGGPPGVEANLVDGNIAYVRLPGFFPGAADDVLQAITALRNNATLRGVILDLRGNAGGSPTEVVRLLGAFAHDAITSYWCDVKYHCTANRTDDSVALLNLRLVALTDRNCASACDSFTSAVKDLHLGTLIGTRTAGAVAGPAGGLYRLDDGSTITLPKYHELAANGEIVNTVGVAPDYYAPLTAAELSAGHDPGLAKAVELLR
jgi:carboxyl-terminal processing protease